MKPCSPTILNAHKHCMANREALLTSRRAGCFCCLSVYDPQEITEWIDEGRVTALCPRCGIDAVLAESAGYPLTPAFLKDMQAYWFSPAE